MNETNFSFKPNDKMKNRRHPMNVQIINENQTTIKIVKPSSTPDAQPYIGYCSIEVILNFLVELINIFFFRVQ